jgi:hypothetical protein
MNNRWQEFIFSYSQIVAGRREIINEGRKGLILN